jgi:hypothetical protein
MARRSDEAYAAASLSDRTTIAMLRWNAFHAITGGWV